MLAKLAAWLKSFFKSPPAEEWEGDKFDLYKPRERLIYAYFDGQKEVKVDPLLLYRRVMSEWQNIYTDAQVARSPSKGNLKAHHSMMAKIREVFDLKPYTEGGLTEQEAIDLLDHFMVFSEVIKKNYSRPATSPPATSPPTPPSSATPSGGSSEGNPATSNSSGSGSTESVSPTSTPTPSPSAPESPSA